MSHPLTIDDTSTAVPAASIPTKHPHSLTGNILLHRNFPARELESRDVLVYLPPGYEAAGNRSRRYPVVYFQDGQNCFDGATSYIPGKEWEVDETAERLINTGQIQPLIIVGVYNTGVERMNEYTPVKDNRGRGGRAKEYGKFLVHELKPFIDRTYRTRKDAESTGLVGSSLGGLVTLHIGLHHSSTFRRLAVMSPSVWWADRAIIQEVQALKKHLPLKLWLDIGKDEGFSTLPDTRLLRDALVDKGWKLNEDLYYFEAELATHTEEAWAARMEPVLKYLYPPEPEHRRE